MRGKSPRDGWRRTRSDASGTQRPGIARVVTAIGGEPAIASQIVRMANSAALNPRRIPAPDLRAAITRTSENLPVGEGALLLGTWQAVYLWEHRRAPHRREVALTMVGD